MMTELEYDATKLKIEQENEEKLKRYPILEKQLEVAVKCLKEYADSSNWWTTENGDKCEYATDGYEEAQEALQMIKELDR